MGFALRMEASCFIARPRVTIRPLGVLGGGDRSSFRWPAGVKLAFGG
jgi:hypothetical protein